MGSRKKISVDKNGMPAICPATVQEIMLGLRWAEDEMTVDDLVMIQAETERALAKRGASESAPYDVQLAEIVAIAQSMPGTGGHRALTKIVRDLEGDGPISEMLFTLDRALFQRVINLLCEFKKTGSCMSFNALHAQAKAAHPEDA